MVTVRLRRLCSRAPMIFKAGGEGVSIDSGGEKRGISPRNQRPVEELMVAGGPEDRISPPSGPEPGPMSIK